MEAFAQDRSGKQVTLTRAVRGKKVLLSCDEAVKDKGEWALEAMGQVPESEGPIADGRIIRMGWSFLTLKARGDALVAHEPDFSRDPLKDLREDVTLSLQVQGKMVAVARSAKANPVFPAFSDEVIAQPGWEEAPALMMTRRLDPAIASSGWLITLKGKDAGETHRFPLWAFLRRRPVLLRPLALGFGVVVHVEGEEIVRVELPG